MDKYNLHSTFEINKQIDPIEEANKRYAEKLKVEKTIPVYDSRRLELYSEMANNPDLALNACGLETIKKICSIDQNAAYTILALISQGVEKDNFDDIGMNFRKFIYKKLEEEEKNAKKYR